MKNITLSLPDEAAEAFEKLPKEDKVKTALFIEAYTKPLSEEAFANTLRTMAQEARANGLTEQEIETFLNSLS
jgi:site-specific recombinase XerD